MARTLGHDQLVVPVAGCRLQEPLEQARVAAREDQLVGVHVLARLRADRAAAGLQLRAHLQYGEDS